MGLQIKKRITLCADDFGQNEAISQGILTLIERKRLSATSCMTNMPAWPMMATKLALCKNQAQVGLHFNLTQGQALSKNGASLFASINTLIKQAFLKQLKQAFIEDELSAQLDAFISAFGSKPDFIDGHQHIHHLPIVRDALLNVYKAYYPNNEAWIRVSSNGLFNTIKSASRCPKMLIITLTGALALKKMLEVNKVLHNTTFSGTYAFSSQANYPALFDRFLTEVDDGGLIMCHPGLKSSDQADPIYSTRLQEFDYFNSDAFNADCLLFSS